MSRRGLAPSQFERALAVLSRRCERQHKGNNAELARELKISQPAMWQIMNRRSPPSRETLEVLAKLEGTSVESILTSPRERAAEIARDGGIRESGIAAALTEPDDESRSVLWWIDRMRTHAALAEPSTTRGAA